MKRNRTCFPSKGKDGICRISACSRYGTYYKRLDNHLSRYHKGTTRSMNDKLPHLNSYKSDFLQQVRQGHCTSPNLDNVPVAPSGETSQKLREVASNPISSSTSSSTNDQESSVTSLTKGEVKRCLFTPNSKKKECGFMKPVQFAMHQGRQKNTKEEHTEKEPKNNTISTYRYIPFDIVSQKDSIGEWSADTLRFLIHSTCSYNVRSLLCFVREKGLSVREYYNTELCKEVFGEVSLPFLEEVYRHRIAIMSYYRRLGCYPNVDGNRVNICIACDETGDNCKCPALDTSFYLFCRRPCLKTEFDCSKCKKWTVSSHVCFDFFFCTTCDQYYKSTKDKSYPSYCC